MSLIVTGGLGTLGPDTELLVTSGLGAPGAAVGIFDVVSAALVAPSTVRVIFGSTPLLGDPTLATDGLNPALYTLAGPAGAFASPVVVMAVPEDPKAVDVYTFERLAPGAWTVTVASTLQSVAAAVLTTPRSAPFSVGVPLVSSSVSGGAEEESLVRRWLNPALVGPTWDSLIAALDLDHDVLAALARAAYDQVSVASAGGAYLDRRMGELGIRRPPGVGMADGDFRALGLLLANERVTRRAFLDLLEVFYTPDATTASVSAGAPEPYALRHGDELSVLVGERRVVTTTFDRAEFSQIAQASAAEVAEAINRAGIAAGVRIRAVAARDPGTTLVGVRIYADASGLTSTIRVIGGRAQLALEFPTPLFPTASTPFGTWDIDLSPTDLDRTRFTLNGSSAYDLSLVRPGDYLVVSGQEFDETLIGSSEILAVSVSYPGNVLTRWFEIPRVGGLSITQLGGTTTQLGVVQRAATSLAFFRPSLRTVHDNPRRALVLRRDAGSVNLLLPTTSAVVRRGTGLAAYLPARPAVGVSFLARGAAGVVTAATAVAHGLAPGDRVRLDGVAFGTAAPAVAPGSPSASIASPPVTQTGTTDAGLQSTASACASYEGVHGAACALGDGFSLLVGGKTDHGTPTPATRLALFRVTNIGSLSGATQLSYEWRRPTNAVAHAEYCQATALPTGAALVTGGSDNLAAASAATTLISHSLLPSETYSVTALAAMGVGRAMHRTTLLPDGKVLVAGGFTTYPTPLATCQRWNPATQTWGAAASMGRARMDHGQIALADGRVLVAGGRTAAATPIPFCEIYDPTGNTWSRTGNLAVARYGHALVALADGRILAVGGRGYNITNDTVDAALASAEVYDPATGAWLPAGSLAAARERPAAALLSFAGAPRGAVVVAGGETTTVEFYDVARGRWRPSLAALSVVRRGALGVPVSGGLLLAGGESAAAITSETSHVFVGGAEQILDGRAGGVVRVVSTPTTTLFTYNTDSAAVGSAGAAEALPTAAPDAGGRGPYLFDPDGLPVTGIGGTLAAALEAGRRYPALTLATDVTATPASAFPDAPGWLALRFGRAGAVGPVPYLGRLSATQLRLDASFEFPTTCGIGDDVVLLSSRSAEPIDPTTGFYLTPGVAGRIAAAAFADDVVAGGMKLHRRILYPSDRGLGGEGAPTAGASRLSGIVSVYASDNVSADLATAREETE